MISTWDTTTRFNVKMFLDMSYENAVLRLQHSQSIYVYNDIGLSEERLEEAYEVFFSACKDAGRVKKLKVGSDTAGAIAKMSDFLVSYHKIKVLEIVTSFTQHSSVDALVKALKINPNLQHLSITINFSGVYLKPLFDAIERSTNLLSLGISGNVSKATLSLFFAAVAASKSIEWVGIGNICYDQFDLHFDRIGGKPTNPINGIAYVLYENTNLKRLRLVCQYIDDLTAQCLELAINKRTCSLNERKCSLNEIEFTTCKFSEDAIERIATLLMSTEMIRVVNFSGTSIKSQHFGDLVNALIENGKRSRSITHIKFNFCDLGDIAACYLTKLMEHNTAIESIEVRHNRFGRFAYTCLQEALVENNTITNFVIYKPESEVLGELIKENKRISYHDRMNWAIKCADAIEKNLVLDMSYQVLYYLGLNLEKVAKYKKKPISLKKDAKKMIIEKFQK